MIMKTRLMNDLEQTCWTHVIPSAYLWNNNTPFYTFLQPILYTMIRCMILYELRGWIKTACMRLPYPRQTHQWTVLQCKLYTANLPLRSLDIRILDGIACNVNVED